MRNNKNFFRILILLIALGTVIMLNDVYPQSNPKIQVLYFHGERRCKTCLKIEELSKETINNSYKEQLNSNFITYETVNFDEEKNQGMVDKFKVEGSSLILNSIDKNGKEVFVDLTELAFKNAFKEDKFIEILKYNVDILIKQVNQ